MSVVDVDLELLKRELLRDEGLRLEAYQDSLGKWTQGVGHLLTTEPPHPAWSREQAMETLGQDLDDALVRCRIMSCWASLDTDGRRRALLNMRFQLGGRLESFKLSLSLIVKQKWLQAGQELRKSLWYLQTPIRAERVIRMIEGSID